MKNTYKRMSEEQTLQAPLRLELDTQKEIT